MTLETFLQRSYTPFHAVRYARELLDAAGFTEDDGSLEGLRIGDKRYVDRGTGLFAFSAGSAPVFHVAESHTDSPCLKVKNVQPGLPARLNVERYGGGLYERFFDRRLKVAGRIVTQKDGGLSSILYESPFEAVIPSLAPHFGEQDALRVSTQLYPFLGASDDWLPPDTLDYDLFVVPGEMPFLAGIANEYLCSPRLDNLVSVYASIRAIASVKPDGLAVAALFDSEEIGSNSVYGAAGSYFTRLLQTAAKRLGFDYNAAAGRSLALSVDNAHAAHPAHPDKADTCVKVTLDGGIVVKHHPNYATDGLTAAMAKAVFQDAGVPYQDYYHPSDLRCGSTLGLLVAAGAGIPTCDVGCAQLAMHAPVETMAVVSPAQLQTALTAFYARPLPKL